MLAPLSSSEMNQSSPKPVRGATVVIPDHVRAGLE